MRSRLLVAPLGLALFALGCGGGSPSDPTASPRLEVSWPARVRGVAAPVLAQNVRVVLTPSAGNATPTEAFFDRPSGADAAGLTQTLRLPSTKPGTYTLDVRFLVAGTPPGGANGPLAEATLLVKVLRGGEIQRADGTPLGAVATQGKVARLYTYATFCEVGESRTVPVTILLQDGNVLAAPPEALHFAFTGAEGVLRLNADGSVTGVGEGQATLVISAGDATSAPTPFTVFGAFLTPRLASIGTAETPSLLYDPTRGSLWGIGQGGASELDPATGTVRRTVSASVPSKRIAISDDGAALYAVGRGVRDETDSVERIDLATGQVTQGFSLVSPEGASSVVSDLAVLPGRNDVAAFSWYAEGQQASGPGHVEVYQGSSRLPNGIEASAVGSLAWLSATRLAYVSREAGASESNLRVANANDQGLVVDPASVGNLVSAAGQFALAEGRIYAFDGSVFDAATLAPVGRLPIASLNAQGIAVANGAVYVLYPDASAGECLAVYRASDFSVVTRRRVTNTSYGIVSPLVRWGAQGLAFQNRGTVYLIDNPPGL